MSLRKFFLAMFCGMLVSATVTAATDEAMPHTLSWNELEALPLPPAAPRIAYGSAPEQFGELRVPLHASKKKLPVVMLIHGGCWLAEFDYLHLTRLAAVLNDEGYATWTIEYRRLGDAGGGWPNTLLDVAHAADYLRVLARTQPLDLKRVVFVGHSAGGHLALWLSARHKLKAGSALYARYPLKPAGVVGLAPITDLVTYRIGPPDSCNAAVDQLMGGAPDVQPQRYAQASPLALLPLGVRQRIIHGVNDRIVPMQSAQHYVDAASGHGDDARLRLLPVAGHFELVAPQEPALPVLKEVLRELLK